MSVELPFAPVDTVIRRNAGTLRVSADAAEELARQIQSFGAELAEQAAERADADGRKTIMASDFIGLPTVTEFEPISLKDNDLTLPIAPVDRIARLHLAQRYRVSMDARVALANILEAFADSVAGKAALLARHAGRRTIQAEDITVYFELME